MKKTILTLLIGASALAGAFAQATSSTASSSVAAMPVKASIVASSTANLVCASNAVVKRDDAVIAAHEAHSVAIKNALIARRDSLKSAWGMADKSARETARKAAWSKFRIDMQTANKNMKTASKAAWSSFNSDLKLCGIRNHGEREVGSHEGMAY